jgi:uncharacterized protein YjbJ (UPF0337 family)
MNRDQVEGTAREGLGAVKEGAGKLMGDAKTRASGMYDEAAGAAQQAYGQARDLTEQGAAIVQRQMEPIRGGAPSRLASSDSSLAGLRGEGTEAALPANAKFP